MDPKKMTKRMRRYSVAPQSFLESTNNETERNNNLEQQIKDMKEVYEKEIKKLSLYGLQLVEEIRQLEEEKEEWKEEKVGLKEDRTLLENNVYKLKNQKTDLIVNIEEIREENQRMKEEFNIACDEIRRLKEVNKRIRNEQKVLREENSNLQEKVKREKTRRKLSGIASASKIKERMNTNSRSDGSNEENGNGNKEKRPTSTRFRKLKRKLSRANTQMFKILNDKELKEVETRNELLSLKLEREQYQENMVKHQKIEEFFKSKRNEIEEELYSTKKSLTTLREDSIFYMNQFFDRKQFNQMNDALQKIHDYANQQYQQHQQIQKKEEQKQKQQQEKEQKKQQQQKEKRKKIQQDCVVIQNVQKTLKLDWKELKDSFIMIHQHVKDQIQEIQYYIDEKKFDVYKLYASIQMKAIKDLGIIDFYERKRIDPEKHANIMMMMISKKEEEEERDWNLQRLEVKGKTIQILEIDSVNMIHEISFEDHLRVEKVEEKKKKELLLRMQFKKGEKGEEEEIIFKMKKDEIEEWESFLRIWLKFCVDLKYSKSFFVNKKTNQSQQPQKQQKKYNLRDNTTPTKSRNNKRKAKVFVN